MSPDPCAGVGGRVHRINRGAHRQFHGQGGHSGGRRPGNVGEDGPILVAVLVCGGREGVGAGDRAGNIAEGFAAVDAHLPPDSGGRAAARRRRELYCLIRINGLIARVGGYHRRCIHGQGGGARSPTPAIW